MSHMTHSYVWHMAVTDHLSHNNAYVTHDMCHVSHEWVTNESRMRHEWVTNEFVWQCVCHTWHVSCESRMSHEWVTNESRMSHEWVTCHTTMHMSHMTYVMWVTNESRMSHEWVTNESRMSHEWVTNESPVTQANKFVCVWHVWLAITIIEKMIWF